LSSHLRLFLSTRKAYNKKIMKIWSLKAMKKITGNPNRKGEMISRVIILLDSITIFSTKL
jgi:hypothetical protein